MVKLNIQAQSLQDYFVFLVPRYFVWSFTDLVAMMLPVSEIAAFCDVSKITDMALILLAKLMARMFKFLIAFSIISMLTPISLRVLTSVVNRVIDLVFSESSRNGTGNSSYSFTKFSNVSVKIFGSFWGLLV